MTDSRKKIRVAVLYGGPSSEHEVSLRSAASILKNLDRSKFEIVPIGIDRKGRWLWNDLALIEAEVGKGSLPILKDAPEVYLPSKEQSGTTTLLPVNGSQKISQALIDVVFPILHGPLLEDGSIQGLFELAGIPYVGAGVLCSAVGMDKEFSKRLAVTHKIPVAPWVVLHQATWKDKFESTASAIKRDLGYPVFTKPANTGSSVGVSKIKSENELRAGLEEAFRYDQKVLVEKGIPAREIEFSALENLNDPENPFISKPGEIVPTHEFYSYEAKYLDDNGAELHIPARLTNEQLAEGTAMARAVFVALQVEAMARIDLFLDKNTGKFWFNEINTLPGFTTISMYPKLWEASGMGTTELLTKLIEIAMQRFDRKKKLKRSR